MVKFLLSEGANPSVAEANGITPLHWAASHGDLETVQSLVAGGADLKAKNGGGKTPLEEAALRNRTAIVEFFSDYRDCKYR